MVFTIVDHNLTLFIMINSIWLWREPKCLKVKGQSKNNESISACCISIRLSTSSNKRIKLKLNYLIFTMLLLKPDNHFFMVGKTLLEDEETSDIIFRTETAKFYAHSHLLLHHLEFLSSLVCENCRYGHQKIVIILPDVESEFLEVGLMEFYLKGDATKLNNILGIKNADSNQSDEINSGSCENLNQTEIDQVIFSLMKEKIII